MSQVFGVSYRFREGASNQILSCTLTGGALYESVAHSPIPSLVGNLCCGSSSFISNSTFPGLGFESQSRSFFRFFSSLNFLQRPINGEYFLNIFIDWLTWVAIRVTAQKIASTGDSNPWPGNVEFEVELELPQYGGEQHTHAMQSNHTVHENRESAQWYLLLHTVFRWVFIRQLPLSSSR